MRAKFQRQMKRLLYIVLCWTLALPMVAQEEELCINGILLYKDDFGGNDPSDPLVSTTPVQGMTYSQIFVTAPGSGGSMGGGSYLVSKEGYRNSTLTNYSVWHIMDDHTYPNDKTRGYLVEIDALGSGNSEFYSTIIDGLCAGKKLTFSAYVANLTTAGQYISWISRNYIHPKLSFIISDPVTGTELARYDTDTISHDWGPSAIDGSPRKKWQESADWQLVGMNFTIPNGIQSVRLAIRNNAKGSSTGNDFAMDDIEIRLCQTPDTIRTDTTVCDTVSRITWRGKEFALADTLRDTLSCSCGFDSIYYELHVTTVHCEEELCIDGTLLFREDFGGNDPNDPAVSSMNVPGMSSQYYNSGNSLGSGHYTVRKQGWHNGIQWHLQDDHTYPGDYTRGYLLEVDGRGGAEPFYSKTIDGLCAGSKLTFSAYVVNVHYAGQLDYFGSSYVYPRMKFVLKDPTTGAVLAEKSTGDIQPDWRYGTPETWKYARDNQLSAEWQLIGMNFVVPDGIESIQMYIYNDVAHNGTGNDFALDDIEIHLCAPPVTIAGESEVCTNTSTTLTANFSNDGTFAEPLEYKWWYSTDSITWTERPDFIGKNPNIDAIQKADSGWYKVAVSGDGNIDNINCRAVSDPFLLKVNKCTEDLCIDGILLFREDFDGNDPDDPEVISDADAARAAVLGMSSGYSPCLSRTSGMSSGKFLVTKQGYQNGIQWHIMDDHTYPNDKTKGYLLQIDGRGGDAPFYTTMIEGLCPGIRLTFSAYVANVMTWGHYTNPNRDDIYPRMKFVLTDPSSGTELATYDTGDIPFDSAFIGDNSSWQYSAHWRLIGMNFTVPDNTNQVKLTIYNNVAQNGSGNDFALDDIEIHLCMTPDTIRTDTTVCDTIDQIVWRGKAFAIADTLRDTLRSSCGFDSIYYLMRVETEHCEKPEPPVEELCMDGILLFREDFGGNDSSDPRVSTNPVPGMSYTQATNDVFRSMGSGKYIVTKSGYCNGDTTGWSLPGADQSTYRSQWYIQDDHTYPNDYSRGYFMEIDGSGGNQQFYQTEISGLCEGIELTFSAYVANVFTWFQYDWYTRNRGPVIAPCLKFVLTNPQTGETLAEKNTQQIPFAEDLAVKTDWQYSSPWYLVGMNFIVPTGTPAIRLTIYNNVTNGNGNDFALDDIEIRLCMTPDTIRTDTTACDTLQQIAWRGKEYAVAATLRDTVFSSCGFDSIYYELHVETEHCERPKPPEPPVPPCPEIVTERADTTVCDTLMPFTWRGMVFEEEGEKRWMEKSPRDCDSIEHVYTLSTIHCEKPEPPEPPEPADTLYEIIVNKYNWQLLCNNVALRGYFPGRTATAFQWYKDEHPIPGATGDDYSEHNELQGVFQLNVHLNDGRSIWSNIIEIDGPKEAPTRVQIYNSQGIPVSEGQVTRGVYLYRYEKGEEVWTEKKIVL